MTNILEEIIAHKKMEIAALDASSLRRAAEASPVPGDFLTPFRLPPFSLKMGGEKEGGRVKLIAELKRASPSKGLLASQLDLFEVAGIYAENGASAISVLTDEKYFLGKLDTLRELRFSHRSPLPLLRKDFLIAASQLYESRVYGADAVLLIAAALADDGHLADLHALALELKLTPLVEVHDQRELERVLKLGGLQLIGINNRDLNTFEVSLETTERLRPNIPADIAVVSESGIFNAGDVERLAEAGVDAVLVGEALITAPDIAARVRELTGVKVP